MAKFSKLKEMTDVQFTELVKESKSIAQVREALGMSGGGSQALVKQRIKELGLDVSHFLGQAIHRGKKFIDDNDIFRENSRHSEGSIRCFAMKRGLVDYACSTCNIGNTWNGKPLSLELDHINGDPTDNRVENLRFLCPNCHSQTDTFRGRNVNTGFKKVSDEDLLSALKTTDSLRQALIKVGLSPKGGNYGRCYKLLSQMQIFPTP